MTSKIRRKRIRSFVERAVQSNARPGKTFSSNDVVLWLKEICSERIVPSQHFIAGHLRRMDTLVSHKTYKSCGKIRGVRWSLVGGQHAKIP